ncbi:MAG: peptidylprolyl isomerase [Deltaproteobacteria bacterium]|nr:peptidylprolyl isomerase [Deltaproteobacteria bacterium]
MSVVKRNLAAVLTVFCVGSSHAPSVRAQSRDAGRGPVDASVRSPEETARRATVLARVGDLTITVGEFEDTLNEAPAPVRQTYTDPARQREYLQNMVDTLLLAREAQRRGVERQPEVAQQIRRILSSRLMQVEVLQTIGPDSVSDTDLRAYYETNVHDWVQPEQRRATVIYTQDRAAADDVLRLVRAARGNLHTIQELAHTRSVDERSRENHGDVFYFRATHTGTPAVRADAGASADAGAPGMDPAVSAAAFGLARELEVAEPVQCANRVWAVVVLTGIRPALSRTIEDAGVRSSITAAIVHQRRRAREQSLLETLRGRYRVVEHPERVDALRLPTADLGGMPALVPQAGPNGASVPRRPEGETNGSTPVPVAPAREPVAR